MKGRVKVSLLVEREFALEDLVSHWSDQERAELAIEDPNDDEAGAKYDEAVDALTSDCIAQMVSRGNDDVFVEDFKVVIEDG